MSIFQAVLLGVVQGITEFLPVSSSGHLVLLQRIFGIAEPALFFDTMLHGGTLLAVFAALRSDIWNIIRRPFQRLTILLAIATAVTAGIAFAFKNQIEEAFASARWLGPAFLLTALALFASEYFSRRGMGGFTPGSYRNDAEMNGFDAVFIGFLQGVAVIPGVSRSGFTLSGALFRRLERDLAARFSFLLAIPAILGALVFQIKDLVEASGFERVNPAASSGLVGGVGVAALVAGTAAAAIVGFASVTLMLRIVRQRSLVGFGVYTAILGSLVLIDQNITHFVF
jgi:undecaprenyl-diphosphatase